MSIEVTNVSNNPSTPGGTIQSFSCQLIGDGITTTFELNLSKAPFDFKLDNIPSSVDLVLDGADGLPDVTGVISTNGNGDVIISCTLASPLEAISGHLETNPATYMTGILIYNV